MNDIQGIKATFHRRDFYTGVKRHYEKRVINPLMAHDDANMTLYVDESEREFLDVLPQESVMLDTVDVGAYLASLIFPGGMICDDCMLPLRECKCENWHGTDGDDEEPGTNDYLGDADPRTHGVDAPEYVDDTDTHPAAICPVCGHEMEWEHYDDEEDCDIFRCLTDDCPVGDDVAFPRKDGEPTVYSYAPHGAVAYDVDTPEGAAAAHRADMMRVADPNEY